ncbi:MAG TPA: hypothetical protein VN455_07060 [Methanotrichaceae archaeon]|nr:hypothetical protein [Methanotrichaceae archaeon]
MAISLLPLSASAGGCGKWVVRPDNSYDFLADPAFDDITNATSEDATPLKGAEAAAAAQKEDGPKEPEVAQSQAYPDISGKWAIRLNDSRSRYLDMILIQSGGKLQGYGSLVAEGITSPLTATGSLSDDGLSLEAKLTQVERTGPDKKYMIDLGPGKSTFSGGYEEYIGDSLIEKGTVTANRPGA